MRRREWIILGQTLFGVGLLIVWLRVIDVEAVVELLGKTNWAYVILGGTIMLVTTVVRSYRWRLILSPLAKIPVIDLTLISWASSLINFVIPIRSGEIARSLFLKHRDNVKISASLPTVAVDRSLDMLAVLTIGTIGILSGVRLGGSLTVVLAIGVGLFLGFAAFVILAILWQERLLRVAEWAVPGFLGENFRNRLLGILSGLIAGFTAIGRKPRNLFPIVGLSFIAALLDASVFYLLFISVGNPVPPMVALTGYALFAITFIVPGAPGYIGSMEAFGSLVFGGALGVPQAAAASVVLIFHALNALILGIFGGIAIWALGFRPSTAFRSVVDAQALGNLSSSEPQPSVDG